MSALTLHEPVLKLASSRVPEPLRLFFTQAGLAEPPSSVCDLHFDTDSRAGCRKTLLAFTAGRAEINLFLLLSPALNDVVPARLENEPIGTYEDAPLEPDFPWWSPPIDGPGRRYAASGGEIDFVEVIIDDLQGNVYVRAIG